MAGRPKRRARLARMNPESVWGVWVEGPEGDAYDIAVRAPSKAAAILKVLREEEGYTLSAHLVDDRVTARRYGWHIGSIGRKRRR